MRIELSSTKNLFFTSDQHFYHENILRLSKRPFKSAREMNEEIIKRWHTKIPKGATVVSLGDMFLKCNAFEASSILYSLTKDIDRLYYVWGNHENIMDRVLFNFPKVIPSDYLEIVVPEEPNLIVCLHYAMKVWNKCHFGSWHVFGHSHGSLPPDPNSLSTDVGVDCWDFTPISFQELREVMQTKTFKPVDHHGKRKIDVHRNR